MYQHDVWKRIHVLVGTHCILCLYQAWPVCMLSSSPNRINNKMEAFAAIRNLLQQKLDHKLEI